MLSKTIKIVLATFLFAGLAFGQGGDIGPITGGGLQKLAGNNANGFVFTISNPWGPVPEITLELDVPTNTLMGRASAGTGAFENIAIGANLSLSLIGGIPTLTAISGGGGSGDTISDESSSVDGQLALYSGTTGKHIRNTSSSGFVKLNSGVVGFVPNLNVINVQDYGAVGDGVTDNASYFVLAFAAAVSSGLPLYVPPGIYVCNSGLIPTARIKIVGDDKNSATIKAGTNVSLITATDGTSAFIYLGSAAAGSSISGLTIDVNKLNQATQTNGIFIDGSDNCSVTKCQIVNSAGVGIGIQGSKNTIIDSNIIRHTELDSIWMSQSVLDYNTLITNNAITGFSRDGILATGDTRISNNYIAQLEGQGAGIFVPNNTLLNTTITGNTIRQCFSGMDIGSILNGGPSNSGIIVSNNNVSQNYAGGIGTFASGTVITGNQTNDNGICEVGYYTIEPGAVPDFMSNPGSGYTQGDILTLSGGTPIRPAKFRVVGNVGTRGGALNQNTDLSVIDFGAYTVFPNLTGASIAVTGGTGSHAQVWFSSVIIANGGSGYTVGSILQGSNGFMNYPPKFRVESVGVGGAITGFSILSGGGYAAAVGVPITTTLLTGNGSGATFTAQFSARFPGTTTGSSAGIGIGATNLASNGGCVVVGNTSTNTIPGFTPQDAGIGLFNIGSVWPTNFFIASNILTGSTYSITGYFGGTQTNNWQGNGLVGPNIGYNHAALTGAGLLLPTSGSVNIDCSQSDTFYSTLSGTFTVSSFANMADGQRIKIRFQQDGAGSHVVNWPSMKWPGGSAPVQTTGAGKADLYEVTDLNGVFYGERTSANVF